MAYDSIIFDLDGTLWDSSAEVTKIWGNVLSELPDVRETPTESDIKSVMGLSSDKLTARLFPDLSAERGQEIFNLCGEAENRYLRANGASLYPGVAEMLQTLSAKYPLCIVSNCNSGYIEAFMDAYGYRQFIHDWECYGNTGEPKAKNICSVVMRNKFHCPVYIGDTEWDYEAAKSAGVPFIFAAYGFGVVRGVPALMRPMDLIDMV